MYDIILHPDAKTNEEIEKLIENGDPTGLHFSADYSHRAGTGVVAVAADQSNILFVSHKEKHVKSLRQAAARSTLRVILDARPESKAVVYTVLKRVSADGMNRTIATLVALPANEVSDRPFIRDISRLVSRACDLKFDDKNEGIKMNGAGMDMGFALVYDLSRSLYGPDDWSRGGQSDAIDALHNTHGDSGYILSHSWI